jgi:hypothetical protein
VQNYVEALVVHFEQHPINLKKEYKWPTKSPISFDETFECRISDSRLFLAAGTDRFESASKILRWGGIRGRSVDSIRQMSVETPEQLISRGFKGIASWSKIITLHDPYQYLIYDSRVAFAINAILRESGFLGDYFPVPPSRKGGAVHKAQNVVRIATRHEIDKQNFYSAYLGILNNVGDRIDVPAWQIEMALFARGPELAKSLTVE